MTIEDKRFGGDARSWAEHFQWTEILDLLNKRELR